MGKIPWRRKWQPTPVFMPGESHEQRSLVCYSPWGHKESDTTERLHFHWLSFFLKIITVSTSGWFYSTTTVVVVIKTVSRAWLFVIPWTTACQTPLFPTVSQSLLRFMSTESVMLSNHLILFHPLLLLPSNLPSIRVFSRESALCIRWPKDVSVSFSNSLFQWTFRTDFL